MRPQTIMSLVLVLLVAGGASGQGIGEAPGTTTVEPDPIFYVELIVFSYNGGDPAEEDFRHGLDRLVIGPEPRLLPLPPIELESLFDPLPRDETQPPAFEESGETQVTATGAGQAVPSDRLELIDFGARPRATLPDGAGLVPDRFRLLKRSELELGEARARLDRLGAYTVLSHVGWAQTGVDTDRSVRLDLKRLGITNPAGTIEVYLRRFLHVTLDLEYFDGTGAFWIPAVGPGLAPFEYAKSYQLKTERNAIRSDELHYIDHPLFGVLIRITRAPEADPADASAGGGRPAG